ncbi:alpha/beta hydrolase family protein [Bacillus cereus group sp. MYBK59-1]|uniref:Carboxylic ester hydrolase n=1 Tax=Bacillus thuringiensis subsp. jegathesan TaxID=56955 RepID=A0A9X6M3K3_BACTJ|nr:MULTISPECIES: carboxylic ester hydrolase [Bacillus cereus group]KZD30092.1 Carboxylic ester hydrolase [Bacillus cereus]MBJ7954822.1 carboxylic ester hydrolase [Bacillus cereus]MBT0788202.1 carboxylic ester hydrolase [Bacillus cereus]MBX9155176.1 carboxylic ester hydrolase [Bacillus cereus]MCB5899195.1 carboxylic ester hydrolase [Bacillus cereus]
MNFWEVVLIVVNFSLLSWILLIGRETKKWSKLATLIAVVMVTVQLLAEGFRWQMIPAYVSPVILILCYLLTGQKKGFRSSGIFMVKTSLLCIYLFVAVALPLLMPVFSFEEPTGPHRIGTKLYHWVDHQRNEPYSKNPNNWRELMVQIWYPAAEKSKGDPEPYIRNINELSKGLEKTLSIPAFAFSHMELVKSHSFMDLQLSDSENHYPILLFSHGFNGFRNQNTFQVEELASQGYIVLSIDHTFDAAATVFPGGRTAYVQPINLTDEGDSHIKLWEEDVSFVLNQIEKLNENDETGFFTGRLDTSRIGMFGHSYGGATAAQILAKDSRVKAAINMDGTLYGEILPESGIGKPFLLMNAEEPDEADPFEVRERYGRGLAGGGMSMVIPHTDHTSFTDLHLFSPLLQSPGENPKEVHRIINEFSLAFFDQYVKQKDDGSTLKRLITQYPEVNFKINR